MHQNREIQDHRNTDIGCQYYYSENLNWAAENLRLGRMRAEGRGLDMADVEGRKSVSNIKTLMKKNSVNYSPRSNH